MHSDRVPPQWLDRRAVIRDDPDRNASLEETVHSYTNEHIKTLLTRLTVVGLDPGGTTGFSIMKISYEHLVNPSMHIHEYIHTWYHGQVDCGSMSGNAGDSATANGTDLGISETGEAAGVAILDHIIRQQAHWPTAVVIEDFIPQQFNQSRDFLSPVRITARLEQLLWELRATTSHRQQVSEAKSTCTDDRLKKWGLFEGGHSDRHARDADRHALLFLRKLHAKAAKRREAFPIIAEGHKRGLL